MPSPEPLTAPQDSSAGSPPASNRPPLRLVKPTAARELTPLEREFLPPLLEIQESPPSPGHRALLWTLVGLVISLILWSCFGTVSIVATAPGKFIPDGRVKEIQPLESSIVKAIHVREGQHVRQEEVLLELDPALSAAQLQADSDKYGFNRLEQQRLTAELTHGRPAYATSGQSKARIALEEQTRVAREQAHTTKLAAAQATVEEKTQAVAAADATLTKYEELTAIAEERESSARPLVDTGAISRVDYLQLKEDLAQNRNDLAAQQKAVEGARAAQSEAQQAFAQIERDRVADIYEDLNKRVADEPALKGDLDKSTDIYSLNWLRAPVSGVVQKIDVTTIGQVVTPAQSLVTIVPDDTPLIVEATVTNQDIGYLKPGQPVEIKIDTFPFQKYGTLKGRLIWISADAEDKNAASSDLDMRSGAKSPEQDKSQPSSANSSYVYKVHVRTDDSQFTVDGESRTIQSGMTLQADIETDRRRVIEFLLSPIVKYLDEGLTVR